MKTSKFLKQTLAIAVIGLSTTYAAADVENSMYVGTRVGQVKFDNSYKAIQYGVMVGDQLKINDNHKVNFELGVYQTNNKNIHFRDGTSEKMKIQTYDIRTQYRYDIAINENIRIAPKAALAYETNKLKSSSNSDKLNRLYAEVGVEAQFNIGSGFSITPSMTYNKDLHTNTKDFGNVNRRGHGYEVSVAANKSFDNESTLSVAPYYKVYDNSAVGDKIKNTGVKVEYAF